MPTKISKLRASYLDGACPDCYTSIPEHAVDGSQCATCGFVFCEPRPDDDPPRRKSHGKTKSKAKAKAKFKFGTPEHMLETLHLCYQNELDKIGVTTMQGAVDIGFVTAPRQRLTRDQQADVGCRLIRYWHRKTL